MRAKLHNFYVEMSLTQFLAASSSSIDVRSKWPGCLKLLRDTFQIFYLNRYRQIFTIFWMMQ